MFCLIDLELRSLSMHTQLISSTRTSEVEWMVISLLPCHRRWWVHPSTASTGHELSLSFPLGEAKLWGQASNALPLRLELLCATEVTASAADILQWKAGAGPPAHKWTGKHTLLNCKTVITFGEEKDLNPNLLKSVIFPPFDDFY